MPNTNQPDWRIRKKFIPVARQLRHEPTGAENVLWEALRGRRLARMKFKRQFVIGTYIVDFFCAERRLVIEVDGAVHQYTQAADESRQAFLESLDLAVLRFGNDEVFNQLEKVLATIVAGRTNR